jgi:glycolate oxidase FAD binding subunit
VSGDGTTSTTATASGAGSVLRPADLASVREAVLDTSGPLSIAGAGTAARWAGPLGPVDTVLDTTALSGVTVHNPGDMTVAVRAGTPLRELAAELAPHGQHVALDAARVARGATVGGLVATGDAGPGALVHGSLRDLVIGVTVVLADGTVARSGGHVIKNVAGYDLAKLLHGSYGTLAVLVEVVLRLHPVPRRSATVALACPLAEAGEHAARVLASPLEAMALEWCADGPPDGMPDGTSVAHGYGHLLVRVEGTPDALSGRIGRLRELLGAAAVEVGTAEWERHAALVDGGPGQAVLRIGAKPALLPAVLATLPAVTITAGLGTGVATVALPADAAAVAAAHATVHAAGGTSVLRDRPEGLDAPAWGPPPSSVGVLRAVKRAFDPAGRLGPGRFSPWLPTDPAGDHSEAS